MGLGWLGLPLARTLIKYGARVSGCVSSTEKQRILQNQGIDCDVYSLYTPLESQFTFHHTHLSTRFNQASLLLNIPPGRKDLDPERFANSMIALIDFAMMSGLEKIIFISTTSVFGSQSGIISTYSALAPDTASGMAHLNIESHLLTRYPTKSYILRPSGLVGPNSDGSLRHPIYSICRQQNISKANDPVNLIHQKDVIAAIMVLLGQNSTHHVFNLAAIEHPSRKEYYQWCAEHLKLPMPSFLPDIKKRPLGKLIDAQENFDALGLQPVYASPYNML